MNKYYVFLVFVFFSCNNLVLQNTDLKRSDFDKNDIVKKINNQKSAPEWVFLKSKINLTTKGRSLDFNLNVRLKKDSAMLLVVSGPIGIEVIRTLITNDSLYYLNHLEKRGFVKPTSYVQQFLKHNISFYELQDVLLGSPKIPNKDHNKIINSESILLEFLDEQKKISFSINPKTNKIITYKITSNQNFFMYSYDDFEHINGVDFPKNINIKSSYKNETFECKIKNTKIVINTPKKMLFKIPDSYEDQD